MSEELKKGEGRTFDTWATTECDECSQEFQITRTVSKTVFGPVICHDCEAYHKAYDEGVKSVESQYKAHIEKLRKLAEKVHDALCMHGYTTYENLADEANDLLSQSPATSLAQVEAEAIMKFANHIDSEIKNLDSNESEEFFNLIKVSNKAHEYANNLKEQG